jgi:hypothetical protein
MQSSRHTAFRMYGSCKPRSMESHVLSALLCSVQVNATRQSGSRGKRAV